jgi:uncharacterized membrane protein
MEIAVWIVSGLLALMYLFAGFTKTFTPLDKLRVQMGWVDSMKNWTRLVGIVEILGAIGLILPRLLDIAPWLSVAAAFGLVIVQVLAIPLHLRRHEAKSLPFNIVLLLAALFVAIGLLIIL